MRSRNVDIYIRNDVCLGARDAATRRSNRKRNQIMYYASLILRRATVMVAQSFFDEKIACIFVPTL